MKVYQVQYVPVGGAQPRKYNWMVIDALRAPWRWSNDFNRYYNIADLTSAIYRDSSLDIQNFSPLMTYFYNSDHAAYNPVVAFKGFGFTNAIDVKTLHVGDKFIINKFGSYMEITQLTSNYLIFDYKTANGSVAYSNVGLDIKADANECRYSGIPWLANFQNIQSYALNGPSFYVSNNNGWFAYMGNWNGGQGSGPNPVSNVLANGFWSGTEPIDTDDPYVNVEDSEPSGPAEGEGIPDSSDMDIPSVPTVSVADTGFVTLFTPSLAQVKDLADYMWSGFDVSSLKKLFADPMECLLGFNVLPVSIPSTTNKAVKVGNVSTGVYMAKADDQWIEHNCGSITVDLPYGSYLDYAPYTKFSLYLPFIGTVELSTDDVMGKTLTLKYHIDALSCACVAYLKCGSDVLYQFTGACGYSIPLSGNDFRNTVSSIVSLAAIGAGAVASGGMTAPAAVAAGASITSNVMNSKPEVHRSGNIGSAAGMMGIQTPYLIAEYPRACKPKKQYHFLGYPSFVTKKLSDISGYAEFENVILDGVSCTEAERRIILEMCKGGVYL